MTTQPSSHTPNYSCAPHVIARRARRGKLLLGRPDHLCVIASRAQRGVAISCSVARIMPCLPLSKGLRQARARSRDASLLFVTMREGQCAHVYPIPWLDLCEFRAVVARSLLLSERIFRETGSHHQIDCLRQHLNLNALRSGGDDFAVGGDRYRGWTGDFNPTGAGHCHLWLTGVDAAD